MPKLFKYAKVVLRWLAVLFCLRNNVRNLTTHRACIGSCVVLLC